MSLIDDPRYDLLVDAFKLFEFVSEVAWEARDDKLIRGRPRYALLEGGY